MAGDITEGLAALVYSVCIDEVSAEVNNQCEAVFAGGVAQCMAATGYDEATCTAVVEGSLGSGGQAGLTVRQAHLRRRLPRRRKAIDPETHGPPLHHSERHRDL